MKKAILTRASLLLALSNTATDIPVVLPKQEHKKIARGRGNQGDWKTPSTPIGTLPEHVAHNKEIERKKTLKARAKKLRQENK